MGLTDFLWPFKLGNDEAFHSSDDGVADLYQSIGGLPECTFEQEYEKYQTRRWRKGIIHTVLPAGLAGFGLGLSWGIYESRRGLVRHVSRATVVARHTTMVTGMAISVSIAHHALVMMCGYKERPWQPMAAGSLGGAGFSLITSGTLGGPGLAAGAMVGMIYSATNVFSQWYHHKHMLSFMGTQQQREVPIHRVAPEMQHMYRSWLYDHRPVEDLPSLQRRALTTMRTEKDVRLDAQAYREAMKMEPLWKWINFPVWWPIKLTEEEELMDQRMRDDMWERRHREIMDKESTSSYLLTHLSRTEQGRSASGETYVK